MKKIAIKGHVTRGEDVIKALESIGGFNALDLNGTQSAGCYYIENDNSINCKSHFYVVNEYTCYTLEQYEQKFLKNMKNIAIHGHPTRSNDIIKILESLGGVNIQNYKCNSTRLYYYVNDANYIDGHSWACLDKKYKTYTLEEYEQIQKDMEKRTIKIDLTTAREWYKQGGELKKVALQAFTENELKSLPSSWEEYCKINPYVNRDADFLITLDGSITLVPQRYFRSDALFAIPSEKRAEQFIVLNKLLQIRDYYNQGWEPDWTNDNELKSVIVAESNKLFLYAYYNRCALFSFKTKNLRDEFFENFKSDLELIKEFL